MGFTRTEIRVEVTGAEEGARAMRGLASAEDKVSESANRERLAVQDAEQAIVRKTRAQQAARQATEDALKPTTEITKQTGLLAKAGELAASGLSTLRKAAEVIPGLKLEPIIAGLAAGVYALYKAFGPATEATERQTAAFTAQAAAARELAAAQRDMLRGEVAAGTSALQQALDRLGPGVTAEAQDQIIRLAAQRDWAQRARDEAIQRRVRQVGGLVPVSDAEQKQIESLLAQRTKFIEQAEEKDGDDFKLDLKEREALAVKAQAFQAEIVKIRSEANKLADWPTAPMQLSDVVKQTTADLANFDRQLRGFGLGESGRVESAPPTRGQAPAGPRDNIMDLQLQLPVVGNTFPVRAAVEAVQGLPNVTDMAKWREQRAAEAKRFAEQEAADLQAIIDHRNAMMVAHMSPDGVDGVGTPQVPSLLAMMTASDEERAVFDEQMKGASEGMRGIYDETQRLANESTKMLMGLGKGLSNAAAASLLTGRSFKHAANEMLKGLAVQAAGQAIWETALGVGKLAMAAFGNPKALVAAGLHFKSAAMFAGLSAAFAGGASLTGGMRSGGGGGGGGGQGSGGMASAAGTNPYQAEQRTAQPIVIQIGAEVVTRVVDGERRREARRDGITARDAA